MMEIVNRRIQQVINKIESNTCFLLARRIFNGCYSLTSLYTFITYTLASFIFALLFVAQLKTHFVH